MKKIKVYGFINCMQKNIIHWENSWEISIVFKMYNLFISKKYRIQVLYINILLL